MQQRQEIEEKHRRIEELLSFREIYDQAQRNQWNNIRDYPDPRCSCLRMRSMYSAGNLPEFNYIGADEILTGNEITYYAKANHWNGLVIDLAQVEGAPLLCHEQVMDKLLSTILTKLQYHLVMLRSYYTGVSCPKYLLIFRYPEEMVSAIDAFLYRDINPLWRLQVFHPRVYGVPYHFRYAGYGNRYTTECRKTRDTFKVVRSVLELEGQQIVAPDHSLVFGLRDAVPAHFRDDAVQGTSFNNSSFRYSFMDSGGAFGSRRVYRLNFQEPIPLLQQDEELDAQFSMHNQQVSAQILKSTQDGMAWFAQQSALVSRYINWTLNLSNENVLLEERRLSGVPLNHILDTGEHDFNKQFIDTAFIARMEIFQPVPTRIHYSHYEYENNIPVLVRSADGTIPMPNFTAVGHRINTRDFPPRPIPDPPATPQQTPEREMTPQEAPQPVGRNVPPLPPQPRTESQQGSEIEPQMIAADPIIGPELAQLMSRGVREAVRSEGQSIVQEVRGIIANIHPRQEEEDRLVQAHARHNQISNDLASRIQEEVRRIYGATQIIQSDVRRLEDKQKGQFDNMLHTLGSSSQYGADTDQPWGSNPYTPKESWYNEIRATTRQLHKQLQDLASRERILGRQDLMQIDHQVSQYDVRGHEFFTSRVYRELQTNLQFAVSRISSISNEVTTLRQSMDLVNRNMDYFHANFEQCREALKAAALYMVKMARQRQDYEYDVKWWCEGMHSTITDSITQGTGIAHQLLESYTTSTFEQIRSMFQELLTHVDVQAQLNTSPPEIPSKSEVRIRPPPRPTRQGLADRTGDPIVVSIKVDESPKNSEPLIRNPNFGRQPFEQGSSRDHFQTFLPTLPPLKTSKSFTVGDKQENQTESKGAITDISQLYDAPELRGFTQYTQTKLQESNLQAVSLLSEEIQKSTQQIISSQDSAYANQLEQQQQIQQDLKDILSRIQNLSLHSPEKPQTRATKNKRGKTSRPESPLKE